MCNLGCIHRILFTTILAFSVAPSFGQQKQVVNSFIDNWHLAAARADFNSFFSAIADSGTYIGTDASERWTKSEFIVYAKPYFDRGKAWSFTPYDREIGFTRDSTCAWFSELLKTSMGTCRGSGILVKNQGGWKIYQYHLSLTVPNELVGDFKKLVEAFERDDH